MRIIHETDVQYGEAGDIPLLLDILRPENPGSEPRPAIVYVHGGAWMAGDRSYGYIPNLLLVKQGFFTVTISYRFSQIARYPAQIHDVKAAIRFLRAHAEEYHIDPDRIGIWGHSAGGHLSALAGLNGDYPELEGESGNPGYSSKVQAVVPISPPTDFTGPWVTVEGREVQLEELQAITQLLGVLPGTNPTLTRLVSPAQLVQPGDAPSLILHGTVDEVVPYHQAELLRDAELAAGNEVTLLRMPDVTHAAQLHLNPEHVDPFGTKPAVIEFFTRHLGPVPAAE